MMFGGEVCYEIQDEVMSIPLCNPFFLGSEIRTPKLENHKHGTK